MQSKKRNAFIIGLCSVAFALCFAGGVNALPVMQSRADGDQKGTFAQKGLTVQNGAQAISGVIADPVNWRDWAENGALVEASESLDTKVLQSADPIIFTANYPYTTTGREGNYTEYTVEYVEKEYKVTAINDDGDGETYIPVGGYVLSLANGSSFNVNLNDTLLVEGLKVPNKAVESDKGARVAVDSLNALRTMPMLVYYDYDFGSKTGTNSFGTEVSAVFDEASNAFVIEDFRGLGMGDDSGIDIPDNGFVLSAYGESYRGQLVEGNRFSIGDKLSLVGFDYIRFGGEPVTYNYTYVYKNAEDPNDEWAKNEGRWETETTPYDAYRGESQTIIYKHGWSYEGSTGTGTNVYGFEVAVDAEGNVVERNVNVSTIPVGGYVISGHGTGRDFIRSSIPMGAKVTLNEAKREISITTSLNSFFVNTKNTVAEIVSGAEAMIKNLYDVDSESLTEKMERVNESVASLENIKNTIEDSLEEGTWSDADKNRALMQYNTVKLQVEEIAYEILSLSSESRPVSARAVWHRPTEKNLSTLTATLDTYEEIGINLIFVESFFNGYSMFKSNYVEYHKDFKTANYGTYSDYLSAFVALAKERGIEVHAWVEDFYVGLDDKIKLLTEHPDWIMYNADGTYKQKKEGGAYIFIDPANPQVQNFLINYYKELLEKNPDIKGLNLDYIRYPISTKDLDTGYTAYAMKNFARTLGLDGRLTQTDTKKLITQFNQYVLSSSSSAYQKWCDYRMQAVSGFVERVYKEIKLEKEILLSTAVFSSITQTKEQKKQDWQTWFKNGWIDIATPMTYFDSPEEVRNGVAQMIGAVGSNCYFYTGLASSYRGLPAYENNYQIEASYLGGANGYVIFCSTQIIGHEDVQNLLKAGVNSQDAVLPHSSVAEVLNAYFTTVLDRAERLYIPAGNMTSEQKSKLENRFKEILAMNDETYEEVLAIQKAVEKLTKTTGTSSFVKGTSGMRLRETMSELSGILKTKTQILAPAIGEPVIPNPPTSDNNSDNTSDSVSDNTSDSVKEEPKSGCGASLASVGGFGMTAVLSLCALALVGKKRAKKE